MGALRCILMAVWALTVVGISPATAQVERRSFKDLQYEGVTAQVLEPSCATASIVTVLNTQFRANLDEGEVWANYLSTLSPEQQKIALEDGLSLADMGRVVEQLGYKAYIVRISLLDLMRVGRPAIVFMQREGPGAYRHFLVLDELDGNRVSLRDPALGKRREHVEIFMQAWQGLAVFIGPAGSG